MSLVLLFIEFSAIRACFAGNRLFVGLSPPAMKILTTILFQIPIACRCHVPLR
jgi:hypothetical protein